MRRQPTFSFKIFAELSIFWLLSEVLHLFNRFVAEKNTSLDEQPQILFSSKRRTRQKWESRKKTWNSNSVQRIRPKSFGKFLFIRMSLEFQPKHFNVNVFSEFSSFSGSFFPQKYTLVILKVMFVFFAFQ